MFLGLCPRWQISKKKKIHFSWKMNGKICNINIDKIMIIIFWHLLQRHRVRGKYWRESALFAWHRIIIQTCSCNHLWHNNHLWRGCHHHLWHNYHLLPGCHHHLWHNSERTQGRTLERTQEKTIERTLQRTLEKPQERTLELERTLERTQEKHSEIICRLAERTFVYQMPF